jgi:hypothetical protein
VVRNGDGSTTLDDELRGLGFVPQGESRRGGTMWELAFSTYLRFTLHDYADHVVLTWRFELGDYLLTRGLQVGAGETSFQELYPQRDSRLERDPEALRAELTRVLSTLRFDLADPGL